MGYIVYHETLPSEFLEMQEQYLQYLATGEWFDRPQHDNKGNRDETERLLDEYKRRTQPEQFGLPEHGGQVLQHSNVQERVHNAEGSAANNAANEGSSEVQEVKKRTRQKKEVVAEVAAAPEAAVEAAPVVEAPLVTDTTNIVVPEVVGDEKVY